MASPENASAAPASVAGGDPSVASPAPAGQLLPAVSPTRGGGIRPGRGSSQHRPAAASRANKARGGPRRASAAAKKASKTADPSPSDRLVFAIRADDQPAFDALVQTAELDVNRRTSHGDTALVEACRYARVDMVTVLLHDKQANVNLTASNRDANRVGLSPLIAACMALQPALVDILLQQPARVNVLQSFGRVNAALVCVLFCVANGRTDEQNERALAILEKLLRYAKQHAQLAKLLAVKPDKVNRLLHMAAALGNWRVLELLREHEDEFKVDFLAHNALGHSVLHVVEHNSFQARSLQFCEPPRPGTASDIEPKRKGGKQERNARKRRQRNQQQADRDDEHKNEDEETSRQEPQSEADKQTFARSRPNRTVEAFHVTRTVMELTKTTGIGAIFSRKGDEGIRGLYIKSLVLAEVGIVSIANEIALMPDERKEKAVYLDGLLYSVASIYPLSVKNSKEYRSLWRQALEKQPGSDRELAPSASSDGEPKRSALAAHEEASGLSPKAFTLISSSLLSHRSLSRRVKVWTMVLVHLLAPFKSDSPLAIDQQPAIAEYSQLQFFRRIAEMLYRSGTKLVFCIFDRTDIEDDESYDEEIEFHLLISLFELFLQFFAPFARTIRDADASTTGVLGVAESFQRAIEPVKRLWPLLIAGLDSIDDSIATPQRFSLLLHILQVIEQLEAAFLADEEATLTKLFAIMKQFAKQEANKKRLKMYVVDQAHLLQTIATTFPMPATFTDKVHPLKNSIDILIRSDPKVLGMDLYSIASIPGIIRLEHKVDYLSMLAEERHGSVSVSISRASEANYVDFILQQILSASTGDLKGEMNITLVNEPGLGVGVTREFFQIVQRCFFQPEFSSLQAGTSPPKPAPHVRDIGAQWLQLARSQGWRNGRSNKKAGDLESGGRSKGRGAVRDGSFVELFPLFEFADKQKRDVLRIAPRTVYISKRTMDAKFPEKSLSVTRKDLLVNHNEVETLKKVYLCIGRLIGLAIRNHQPLAADLPLAFWKFMMQDNSLSWEDYCGSSQVFKRSLQFILDHDFEAEPLDMRFEYTMDVVVVDDESGVSSEGAKQEDQQQQELQGDAVREPTSPAASAPSASVSMEMELQKGMGDVEVTNVNKKEYVRLRAQQFFFGNEFVYYKKMRDGFLDTIARSDLKLFHPAELRRVVRGEPSIDFSSLKKSVLYSRGASPSHGAIQRFWEVVEDFDQETRAKLLTFWSGSPLPPIFGFESKYRSMNADTACWYIDVDSRMQLNLCPMANTCDRRLILPDYSTTAMLKEKLLVALEYGCVGYDRM